MRSTICISLACVLASPAAAVSARSRTADCETDSRTQETLDAGDDTESRAVPITTPWLLESWGFAPDSTNVYASPRLQAELARLAMDVTKADAARSAVPATRSTSDAEAASSFGDDLGHSVIGQPSFQPQRSTTVHERDLALNGRFCVEGYPWFEGVFEGLPHGARLTRFQIWTFDSSSAENILGIALRTCYPEFEPPDITILSTFASFGSGGFQTAVANNENGDAIDTQCAYSLMIRLDGQEAATCSEGNNLQIVAASARWIRQVSPAPDTATFDDVPTTHLFFQHIEALVDSGVTAGCDEDSFCPDAPLTRGQMATFLARALGL